MKFPPNFKRLVGFYEIQKGPPCKEGSMLKGYRCQMKKFTMARAGRK